MNDLTLNMMIAVLEEIFGFWPFWLLVMATVLAAVVMGFVIWRDRGLDSRPLLRAQLTAPVGAIAAILFVQWMTDSGFSDIGGPIDVLVLIAIGIVGAAGATILAYEALVLSKRTR